MASSCFVVEPGYYKKNEFGIRLENIVQIVPAETPYKYQHTGYLTFKTLTLVPVQLKMLEPELLTQQEVFFYYFPKIIAPC